MIKPGRGIALSSCASFVIIQILHATFKGDLPWDGQNKLRAQARP